MKKMTTVYAFDFDGTLTTRDTLLEFIRFARGGWAFLWGFLLFSPLLVAMKLKLYPNWKAKQRIFAHFFRGMTAEEFTALGKQFAAAHATRLMRPEGLERLRQAMAEGAEVVVVSASVAEWVRPFFDDFAGKVQFACTEIEVTEGAVTGRFLTANCYGEEKVRRVLELFPQRSEYTLVAFGDSRGDKELLAFADEGHLQKAGLGKLLDGKLGEVVRFGIVGVVATVIQYGMYLLMLPLLEMVVPSWGQHTWVTVANAVAYFISFCFNFVASTRYTFKVKASAKHGAGFVLSHAVNLSIQTICLNIFVGVGVPKQVAMLPTLCICVPINFLLVRFFLKR